MDSKQRLLKYSDFSVKRQLDSLKNVLGSPIWIIIQILLLFYRFPENCFYVPGGIYKFHLLKETPLKEIEITWEVRTRDNPYNHGKYGKYGKYDKIEGELLLPSELKNNPFLILGNCVNTGRFIVIFINLRALDYDTGDVKVAHANLLLFDRLEAKVFRFEPHGKSPSHYYPEQLDIVLQQTFDKVFKPLLFPNAQDRKFEYLVFPNFIGPQVRQNDYQPEDIRRDEFRRKVLSSNCSVWCYIFVYIRMFYIDLPLNDIISIFTRAGPGGHDVFQSVYIITKIIYNLVNSVYDDPMPIIHTAWNIHVEKYFANPNAFIPFIPSEFDEEAKERYLFKPGKEKKKLSKYKGNDYDTPEDAIRDILSDSVRYVADEKYEQQEKTIKEIWLQLVDMMNISNDEKKTTLLKVRDLTLEEIEELNKLIRKLRNKKTKLKIQKELDNELLFIGWIDFLLAN